MLLLFRSNMLRVSVLIQLWRWYLEFVKKSEGNSITDQAGLKIGTNNEINIEKFVKRYDARSQDSAKLRGIK